MNTNLIKKLKPLFLTLILASLASACCRSNDGGYGAGGGGGGYYDDDGTYYPDDGYNGGWDNGGYNNNNGGYNNDNNGGYGNNNGGWGNNNGGWGNNNGGSNNNGGGYGNNNGGWGNNNGGYGNNNGGYGNNNGGWNYSEETQTAQSSDEQRTIEKKKLLEQRAVELVERYQMKLESARKLTKLADQISRLSKANKLTVADQQDIADRALAVAGIQPQEVNDALGDIMNQRNERALDDLVVKAAKNLGMPSTAGIKEEILPKLGIRI
jgi:hypothetical protein